MSIIIGLLSGGIGSGLMAIVSICIQRYWHNKDKSSEKMDAQTEALKVIMIDRVRWLGRSYIRNGKISLEDKETLTGMYNAYKALGGNGHLSMVMDEVNKLEVS